MSRFEVKTSGYRIKHLSEITGFSTHVLRKWEQRYQILAPQRANNGYRLFDQNDLQILLFIRSQLIAGGTIGQLACRGRSALIAEMNSGAITISEAQKKYKPQAEEIVHAARRGDRVVVEKTLNKLIQQLGFETALMRIFFPVLRFIGDLWHQGQISVSGEQLVSQPIHSLLAAYNHQNGVSSPQAVIACLPNDFHEIGAMTVAQLLCKNGWKVTYLGPNSNIEMIRLSCKRHSTRLVVLSCIVEVSSTDMKHLIDKIVKQLLPITNVAIGGKGASDYIDWLESKGIRYIENIEEVNGLTPRSEIFARSASRKVQYC